MNKFYSILLSLIFVIVTGCVPTSIVTAVIGATAGCLAGDDCDPRDTLLGGVTGYTVGGILRDIDRAYKNVAEPRRPRLEHDPFGDGSYKYGNYHALKLSSQCASKYLGSTNMRVVRACEESVAAAERDRDEALRVKEEQRIRGLIQRARDHGYKSVVK